jgi:hypothetical protein
MDAAEVAEHDACTAEGGFSAKAEAKKWFAHEPAEWLRGNESGRFDWGYPSSPLRAGENRKQGSR